MQLYYLLTLVAIKEVVVKYKSFALISLIFSISLFCMDTNPYAAWGITFTNKYTQKYFESLLQKFYTERQERTWLVGRQMAHQADIEWQLQEAQRNKKHLRIYMPPYIDPSLRARVMQHNAQYRIPWVAKKRRVRV